MSLQLISEYGGDSSDDDVPGPRVSSKRVFKEDSETEESEPNRKRSQPRLPLPQQFAIQRMEVVEDPTLHEGRIRSFSHEGGNWASFVYIPFEATVALKELYVYMEETLPKALEVKISEDLHISLTKTVVLKYHWITSFVQEVRKQLQGFRKFLLVFDGVKVYCNEERTRTFVGIQMKSGHDYLIQMANALDHCLREFELPTFYQEASFHMSIAWCVGDAQKELESYVSLLNNKLGFIMEQHPEENFYVVAATVMCKIGFK